MYPLKVIFAENKFGTYCMPKISAHRLVPRTLKEGKVHEPDTLDFMLNIKRPGDIVTAGTFFGDFLPALVLHRNDNEDRMIYAYEPHPENCACARITLAMNNIENHVWLEELALSDKVGELTFVMTEGKKELGGGSHVLLKKEREPDPKKRRETTVKTVTLDDELLSMDETTQEPIACIQLDLEKHEEQALRGAEQVIRRCKPILILETVPESKWWVDLCDELGYVETRKLHLNTVFEAPECKENA